MYEALVSRDRAYEGVFWTGVRTTGVFCRPTCPARKPPRENVEFFPSQQEALLAGYRPCQRCHPLEPEGATPSWLRPLLDRVESEPARRWTDQDLREAGVPPSRVRRWFRAHHGMTFHAYARSRRLGVALGQIGVGADITDTAYDSGFESLSGFREAFGRLFGDSPGRSRGRAVVIATRVLTPLGPMLTVASDEGLRLLEFTDRRMLETQIKRLRTRLRCIITPGESRHVELLRRELDAYFAGSLDRFTVPMAPVGTDFQRSVWQQLEAIPYGETRTYEEVARAGLTGYGGGLWRKRYLLDLELGRAPDQSS